MANYKFPLKLNSDISAFIMMSAFKWATRGKKNQLVTVNKTSEDTIVLPIPNNGIINSINNNWAEQDILKSRDFFEGIKASIAKKVKDSLSGLGARYQLHQRGQAINDFASLIYDGVSMRDFNFSWALIPESKEEATTIENIIISLKKNCLPEYQGWKVLYPNFWKIRLVLPTLDDPVTFKDCVMTTLTTTYFEDDKMTFNTGHATKIVLMAAFRELDRIDKTNFK